MELAKAMQIEKRMLNLKDGESCTAAMCGDCPLSTINNGTKLYCQSFRRLHADIYEKILENWDKEHPQKTRMQDFLEKYPKAEVNAQGTPVVCAGFIFGFSKDFRNCINGCKKCWNKPIGEK